MEERKDITPAGENTQEVVQQQEKATQAGEQTQEAPEFFIDADGNIQGDFSDWVAEEQEPASGEQQEEGVAEKQSAGEEQAETQQEAQTEQQAQTNYYTPEELARLELAEIDPSRLPPQLRPYYEELLKQQNLEFAQPQQETQEANIYDQIQELARKRVEEKLGEPFDELNPKHITALAVEANRVAQELEKRAMLQAKVAELAKSEPYFALIDKYAQEKLQELPYKEAIRIQQAIQNGDIDTVLQFWEQCRREFYENKLKQSSSQQSAPAQAQQVQQAKQPPRVEGAGRGEEKPVKRFDPRKLAEMDEDQQVQALIEMGLV